METVVISLGGSIIVPNKINHDFLKQLRKKILKLSKKDKRFIIICGGGNVAREYMQAASKVVDLKNEDLDWLGIHATRLNAHLLRTVFRDISHKRVIKNPADKVNFKDPVLIAAGWKPGRSTDYIAVRLAQNYGAKTVINITNAEFVYDKDPAKFKSAKPIHKISWKDFRKLVGNKWNPGLNLPFDPIASKKAQSSKLQVLIVGKNLENLENAICGKSFKGSIIS